MGDVGFDSAVADDQLGGDLGVGSAADYQVQDLSFPVGEQVEVCRGVGRLRAKCSTSRRVSRLASYRPHVLQAIRAAPPTRCPDE
jgi:hypothetical protein